MLEACPQSDDEICNFWLEVERKAILRQRIGEILGLKIFLRVWLVPRDSHNKMSCRSWLAH